MLHAAIGAPRDLFELVANSVRLFYRVQALVVLEELPLPGLYKHYVFLNVNSAVHLNRIN